MTTPSSQVFESYVPVYDAVPEKWEQARQFLVEHLKKISNAVNIREIGWFLEEELLNGKQFIPPSGATGESQQFRSMFRKVIDFSPLIVGLNQRAHNITFDSNFTLMQLYAAATDSVALLAVPIPSVVDNINMNATFINITSTQPYDRAFAVVEYIREL